MDKNKTDKLEEREQLSVSLINQLEKFIDSLQKYNAKRLNPRSEKDYEYLKIFFKDYFFDQNSRANSLESSAYQRIAKKVNFEFPMKTMFNLCIDGRVLVLLAFGATAGVGSSMRVPGGMLREFIRGTDGKLKLKHGTNYANLLVKVFNLYNIDIVAEVYDSHVGCAARLAEEQAKGRMPEDFGLYADVSHKKQISFASQQFVNEVFHGQKKIVPIQTSFNPHTGYVYMGLETEEALAFASEHGKKFSEEVLDELVKKNKIISTEHLAALPKVEEYLSDCYFKLDWKNEYVASAEKFWNAIDQLKETLGPIIEKHVIALYPELENGRKEKLLEKEERVLLLLANILSGYLHNHSEVKREKGAVVPHMHTRHYPYGVHEEESVQVSEGGYPPNNMAYFVVFSLDEKTLASNVDLSAVLVRNNRREKRVKDTYNIFENLQEFVETSVPVIVQEIIREPLTEEQWVALSHISWKDLPEDWDEMTDLAFLAYLQTKEAMTVSVMIGINNLRRRMAVLYDLANPTSSHLVEHYKVALPVVTGPYRKNQFIVPFVKLGFD